MSESKLLDFEVVGRPSYATVEVKLQDGQEINAESGAMAYMDGTVDMETSSQGGMIGGLKRKLTGESFWVNTFKGPGMVALATNMPGDIIAMDVSASPSGGWIMTKDAFIGGTTNVKVSSKWGGFKSMFGGEGAFLTHVSSEEGDGLFFAGGYGHIKKHEIPQGKEFVVDNGLFFATQESTKFKTSKVGGKKSFILGGEGLVMRFFGPCTVFTQSRDLRGFISLLPIPVR